MINAHGENEFMDEDDGSPLIQNLQDLLEALDHQVRESPTNENVEEFLLGLETTDSNFHNYSFVQNIKENLETQLGPLIDSAIDKHDTKYYDSTLVSNISGALLKSKEFHHVSKALFNSVQLAAENIEISIQENKYNFAVIAKNNDKNQLFGGSSRSDCSTITGVDYMFLPPDKYKDLAKDIDIHKSKATRIQGLSVLQQVPQTDLVTSEAWEPTRNGLLAALDDENEEINLKALRFVSRLFLAGSGIVVKEYFLLLVEDLIEYFNDSTSHMVNMDAGLDFGDKRNILLLRKFALLNKIQLELPSFWLRYSEKYVDEMIEMLTLLLEMHPQPLSENFGERLLSPLHFLSLVDPQADWFKKWTHGFYSRSKIIKAFSLHPYILNSIINSCIDFSEKNENFQKISPTIQSFEETDSYSCRDILYAYFLSSLNLLTHTMLFKDGRESLSKEVNRKGSKNVNDLILLLIKTIISTPTQFLNDSKSLMHPSNAIHEKFKLLSRSGKKACADLICSQEIVQELVNAVRFLEVSDGDELDNHQSILFDLLSLVSLHEKGRDLFLSVHTGYKKSSLDVLCKILSKRITTDVKVSNNLLSLLSIFTHFQQTHKSFDILSQYSLLKKLHSFLQDVKKNHKIKFEELRSNLDTERSNMSQKMMQENSLVKMAIYFENKANEHLLCYALTPKGLLMLCKGNAINDCVSHFLGKFQGRSFNASKFERLGNGVLCNQLFSTAPSIMAVEKAGYVTFLLNKTFFLLEDYTNDSMKTKLTDIPEDLSHRGLNKLFLAIINLLSSHSAFAKLLKYNVSSEHDNKTKNKRLVRVNNVDEFIHHFLLLDSVFKINLLSHPNQSHFFVLNVFHVVVTCLDTVLLLKSKFHLHNVLMSLQEELKLDNGIVIIDPCTIKRNQILLMLYYLGGSNERTVPGDTLLIGDNPYPWPLFYYYPPPSYYVESIKENDTPHDSTIEWECLEKLSSLTPILDSISKENASTNLKEIQKLFVKDIEKGNLPASAKKIADLFDCCLRLHSFDGRHSLTAFTLHLNKKRERKLSDKQHQFKCCESDEFALDMIMRYAVNLRLVAEDSDLLDTMKELLTRSRQWLNGAEKSVEIHAGFEWFLGLFVVLLRENQTEQIWKVLQTFFNSLHFIYMWNTVVYRKEYKPDEDSIHPLFSHVCHWIEHITCMELAQIYAAFNLSGSPPSQICLQWLRQYFLNYLNWPEISLYMCLLFVMGIDYQVYFCVAVLRHLKNEILTHAHQGDLIVFLKVQSIKEFRVSDYIDFMKDMESKYRKVILEDMSQFDSKM